MIWELNREDTRRHLPVTEGAFPIFQHEVRSLENTAAFIPRNPILPPYTLWDSPERVVPTYCSAELFQLLDVPPLQGRWLLPGDNLKGAEHVALISHAFWTKHFNRSSDIVGQRLAVNEFGFRTDYTIVGVMPESFNFPYPVFPDRPDLWLALTYVPFFTPGNNFYTIARLKSGVSLSLAQAELDAVTRQIQAEYPKYYKSQVAEIVPLQDELLKDARGILWSLSIALAFVFLIGCANLANLFLARCAARERALAIRAVLGASRPTLLCQVTIESLVLAAAGGALGLFFAYCLFRALPGLLPSAVYIPRIESVTLSLPVAGFTVCASLIAAALFGLSPTLYICRLHPAQLLGGHVTRLQRPRFMQRPGNLLLISEVTLATTLLTGALLMVQSLKRLTDVEEPYNPEKLLTLDLAFSNLFPDNPRQLSVLYDNFLRSASSIHDVRSVAITDSFPLSQMTQGFKSEAAPGPIAANFLPAELHVVSPNFAEMMALTVQHGRWLEDTDRFDAAPVAAINSAMAEQYWPQTNPVGTTLTTNLRFGSSMPAQYAIVGVVNESRRFGTGEDARPSVFISYRQVPRRSASVVARVTDDPAALARALTQAATAMSPGETTVYNIRSGDAIVSDLTARAQFTTWQLISFSALTALLAMIGLYSLVSVNTSMRIRELGIRMALGATPTNVASLVIRQGLALVAIGAVLGSLAGLSLTRVLSGLLYNTKWTDNLACIGVAAAAFAGISLVACYLPARRATQVDPLVALRYE